MAARTFGFRNTIDRVGVNCVRTKKRKEKKKKKKKMLKEDEEERRGRRGKNEKIGEKKKKPIAQRHRLAIKRDIFLLYLM